MPPQENRPVRATYRLQFRNGMDFARARALVPYLQALGISHLYASPVMTAVSGSTHGYDVTHANEIDPSLGGIDGLRQLARDLHAHGLGLILDIVPNHMAAHLENPWWRSVVTWGRESPFARHFDIDWSAPLTLPFLGQSFEEALADGNIALALDPRGGFPALRYYETFYPLHPETYALVFAEEMSKLHADIGAAAARLSPADEAANRRVLSSLCLASDAVSERLAALSQDQRRLAEIHEAQPWRLTDWRTAGHHLTYRRFFEIGGLVGLRVEDEGVFDDSHRLILDLVRDGTVDGLRIDHVDGLADPAAYLDRLRRAVGPQTYIVVEKILEQTESLPAAWPVQGTTGYEFIPAIAHALVDDAGKRALQAAFTALKPEGMRRTYDAEQTTCKQLMLQENFEGEVAAVTALAKTLAERNGEHFPQGTLRAAIETFITALPVYRSYVTAFTVPEGDRNLVETVRKSAGESVAEPQTRLAIDFIAGLLVGIPRPTASEALSEFHRRLQQLSGPIMAKAVEDTLFYRENALIALNEVGGDPGAPIAGPSAFHAAMARRVAAMPNGLSATATHDTKRGEDARARLYALSEAPEIWTAAVRRWHALNARLSNAPEPAVEWLIYQSLAGLWPTVFPQDEETLKGLADRMALYTTKALREAKLRTNWTTPDIRYEESIIDFVHRLFNHEAFLRDFDETLSPFIDAGLMNALGQSLIKLTAPGIPDIYQGSERGDFSLVDPDNRALLDTGGLRIPERPAATRVNFADYKQWLTNGVLTVRKGPLSAAFEGPYVPLEIAGGDRTALAFFRGTPSAFAITIVPRLTFGKLKPGKLALSDAALEGAALRIPAGFSDRSVISLPSRQILALGPALPLSEIFATEPVGFLYSADI